jgi:large subunit ribosomal protein L6
MSRVGKQPVNIPAGVEVSLGAGKITAKGPKGELSMTIHPNVLISQNGEQLMVSVKNQTDKKNKSLWGLSARLLTNLLVGVTLGFTKQLEVNGIGYRATLSGQDLILQLGHSHPIKYQIPAGIEIKVDKNIITVTGIDKQLVGQTAVQIRALRPPEPYKGKGIKYITEVVRRKAGKAAVKGAE